MTTGNKVARSSGDCNESLVRYKCVFGTPICDVSGTPICGVSGTPIGGVSGASNQSVSDPSGVTRVTRVPGVTLDDAMPMNYSDAMQINNGKEWITTVSSKFQ